jgi:hypothetical protein
MKALLEERQQKSRSLVRAAVARVKAVLEQLSCDLTHRGSDY